jgi:hypothetical protein
MSTAAGANDDGAAQSTSTSAQRQQSSQQQSGGNRGRFTRGSGGDRPQYQRPQLKKCFTGKEEGLGDEYVYQHTEGRDVTDQYACTT